MKQGMLVFALLCVLASYGQDGKRPRDLGIRIGILPTGASNSITDVSGVKVGHVTLDTGDIRTGVTAVLPHGGNIFQEKVPAAVFVGNGFGKMVGTTQVKELGNLESPVILTNTLSVPVATDAVTDYILALPGNEQVQSVNAVVGETNDGFLNDIRRKYITKAHVIEAIRQASTGRVTEGNVGAGTGTVCFGFKGGIGTASRVLPSTVGGYTVGVLVQSNFGGVLVVDGVPVGEELRKYFLRDQLKSGDGSCMIVVATDAPLDARNLERLASRAMLGLGRTGGIASNGSGDYVIAFSTHENLRVPYAPAEQTHTLTLLNNDAISPLFLAVIEATEEAIINSLFAADTMTGKSGRTVSELPVEEVLDIMKKYNALENP